MAASNLTVELEGHGDATLTQANHLATGGEASVYRHGAVVVKIYLDPTKMEKDGMVDKVQALAPLRSDVIVAPAGVAINKKTRKPVGFYLDFVQGEPMARALTTAFWKKTPFTTDLANIVVSKMRRAVEAAHSKSTIMVDANELNWLIELGKDPIPKVIDVDSWAVGKWGASVIMPSIRDYHSKTFNAKTDWFSWGIVTFQLYTGIHPYKGTLDGYSGAEWEKRMRENASVFSPGVRLNAAVRDFNNIPGALLNWYEAVFQKGERSIPPSPFDKAGVQKAAVVRHVSVGVSTGALVMDKLFDVYPVLQTWPCGACLVKQDEVIRAVWDVAKKKRLFEISPEAKNIEVIRVEDGHVIAMLLRGTPTFVFAPDTGGLPRKLDLVLDGHALFRYENRLFLANGVALLELTYLKLAKPTLATKQSIGILSPQATQWFDGVGVERVFTSTFVVTPFLEKEVATTRVPELDGLTVIDARAGNRFVTLIGQDSKGDLCRVDLTFAKDYSTYTAWKGVVDSAELNTVCLPKGICVTIPKDGELTLFQPTSNGARKVADSRMLSSLELGNFDNTVVGTDGAGVLWKISIK